MYYAALPAGATPSPVQALEKPHHQAVYLPSPFPGAAAAQAGFTTATGGPPQHALPHGLRYAPQPAAYAVVSQAGYNAISPAAYHSALPAYSGMQALPAPTSTTYISAAQYPGMSYQAALASQPRSTPFQAAGTPLIATGFPAAMPAGAIPGQPQVAPHHPRHYQIATYPPGYPLPAGSTVPMPYGAAAFGPPF